MLLKDQKRHFEPCGLSSEHLRGLSDESLMIHLQDGHTDVLSVIFDRYNRLVLSIAMKILRDLGEAEDVMQSVFLEIFKSAAQFNPSRGTLKVWILQYAYHRAMNRRQHLAIRNFYKNTDISEIHDEMFISEVTRFNDQEIRHLVTEALCSLDENQRRVLTLAYFDGLSLKEIADRMDETLGNVRHYYYRGLKRLREIVTAEPDSRRARFEAQEQADA